MCLNTIAHIAVRAMQIALLSSSVCCVFQSLSAEELVRAGSRFSARDTFAPGEETSEDARQCLAGLSWPSAEFPVTCDQSQPGYGQFLVRFPSPLPTGDEVNDLVAMEWYPARDADGELMRAPAIVVVHESGSNMAVGRTIARGIQSQNVHAFLIQLPGYGVRKSAREVPVSGVIAALRQAVADVRRARDAVAALPGVDQQAIGLQGTSLGGFVTATVAGLDRGYDRIFILLAGGNLKTVIEQGDRDSASLREKLKRAGIEGDKLQALTQVIEPMRLAHRIDPQATWLYSGAMDKVVPQACSQALAAAARLPDSHNIVLPVDHYSGIVLLPRIVLEICQAMRKGDDAASLETQAPTESKPPASRATDSSDSSARRLLIVAPERFHELLNDFARHKQAILPTDLVSLEQILRDSPGTDDPERLKRYIYQQWRDHQLRYILLVGDADVMPVRYMVLDRVTKPAYDYAFYPSDLYYSDLAKADGSFDDWNANQDSFHAGYYGEVRGEKNKEDPMNYDQVDYRPDVAVGRWPASTEAEVKLLADKTMAYESGLLRQSKAGANRAAVFMVAGWVDARNELNEFAQRLSRDWSVEKRFYADQNQSFDTPPPDETQLLKLLNDGVGLVIHAGHGNDNAWEQCFVLSSFDRLRNADRLPVMISAGCSTAICASLGPYQAYLDVHGKEHAGTDQGEVFDAPPPPPAPYQTGRFNPTGLGEQLLRRSRDGAVAYIGCNTGSQPCALSLVDGFTRALAADRTARLGDCWTSAVTFYVEQQRLDQLLPTESWYPASIFFQGMKFMLFGDPTLPLHSTAVEAPRIESTGS